MDEPTAVKVQLQQEGTQNLHKGHFLQHLNQVNRETVQLGSTSQLLHEAILPRLGDVVAELPNT